MTDRCDTGCKSFVSRRAALVSAVLLSLGGIVAVAWWAAGGSRGEPEQGAGGAGRQVAGESSSTPPQASYVGSAACADCHHEITAAFATHPMSCSITRVSANDVELRESSNMRVSGERLVYDVEFHDGVMTHHDRMFDAAGELIYDQAMPVDYVVGSGRRASRGDVGFRRSRLY
jgi:hypothetical protein